MATLPSKQVLSDVITGKKTVQFDFLAVKIFLGMASSQYRQNPESLGGNIQKFLELLDKNQTLASAQRDIQKLI